MSRIHTHKCKHCGTPVECDGELSRNYDGFPDVICANYHRASGRTDPPICEDCALLKKFQDDLEEPMPRYRGAK